MLASTLRDDFPIFSNLAPSGQTLVYLDSAATSLKPQCVIDAAREAMQRYSANVHRAVHYLGDEATQRFEEARRKVAFFIGAEPHEVVFVRNATEGLNLLARAYPRKGRVVVSLGEHHSNLLCWGVENVTTIPTRPDGTLDQEAVLGELARGDVSILSVSQISNVTGAVTDIKTLADAAHNHGAILVVDAAQSAPHLPIDVLELDCDFLVFSAHKMCGPTGIGALYGKADRLAELTYFLRGGGTVESVRGLEADPRDLPWRFEAGTPAIEAAIGFGAAVDYLFDVDVEEIQAHTHELFQMARKRLEDIPGFRRLGPAEPNSQEAGPLSFTLEGVPSHVAARTLSDAHGICIRSGFHCAESLHQGLQCPPTMRLSFYLYNQPEDLDRFFEALEQIRTLGTKLV